MKVTVYTLRAFAKTEKGGNPAGVVLHADAFSENEMLRVAAKVGFSETAFLQKSEKADVRLRFFTPRAEVDMCGHATIAAFSLLAQKGLLLPGRYTQEIRAGVLPVEIGGDGTVYMRQNPPVFSQTVDRAEIADSLHMPEAWLRKDCPAQIVSTGLRDILVPIETFEKLYAIRPDFAKVAQVSRRYDVVGYHLFCLQTLHGAAAHCRNLAPLYDIPEEAATGTSNGALGCYLHHHGLLAQESGQPLIFEQGYSMRRPSEIRVSLGVENGKITQVRVGGTARGGGTAEIEI